MPANHAAHSAPSATRRRRPAHRAERRPAHRAERRSDPRALRARLAAATSGVAMAAVLVTGTVTGPLVTATPAEASGTMSCGLRNFSDVRPSSTFYQPVTWMACRGLTNGYADGSFGVQRQITRGEVATLLYRQVKPSHPKNNQRYFTDVSSGNTHYQAITWMAQAGLSTGYADRSYRPNQPVTRGELAAILYRLSGTKAAAPARSPYRDMASGQTFYREAAWLKSAGIAKGYSNGTFQPRSNITRGESAMMLYNANSVVVGKGSVTRPALSPLPSTTTWATKAANWATSKAKSSSTYYQWGGNGPNGYDCSGFTRAAFAAGGKSLPRISRDQYTAAKSYVSLANIKVGDLVYWSNNGQASGIYHVAIYVGNGQIAHARNPASGVTLTSLHYSPWNMMKVAGRF